MSEESTFDAVAFLEGYRDDIPKKSKKKTPPPKEVEVSGTSPPHTRSESEVMLTEEERHYQDKYLDCQLPKGFYKGFKPMAIDPTYHTLIMRLKNLVNPNCTLNGILHSILKEHFDRYGNTVRNIINKNIHS